MIRVLIIAVFMTSIAVAGAEAPISIAGLSERDYQSSLAITRELGSFDGYKSYAVEFDSDGLRQMAVMNVPTSEPPASGFPIVIMSHGNANQRLDSFKDYYSSDQMSDEYRRLNSVDVITRYAREGFVVLFPDFRGHGFSETNGKHEGFWQLDRRGRKVVDMNGEHVPRVLDDDGIRFGGFLYSAYYTIDLLNLIAAITDAKKLNGSLMLDQSNLFLWGRSLGGDVTARAMTVSDKIRAASLWVPATMSLWDQAHHYHYDSPCCADGFALETLAVELSTYNSAKGTFLRARDLNPGNFVEQIKNPVLIQVSIDDSGVRSAWGIEFHFALLEYGVATEVIIYPGDAHVFSGAMLERAIQADVAFFRAAMN